MHVRFRQLISLFSRAQRVVGNDADDLRALRRHPRRLLQVAGVLISLLLLIALAAAVALRAGGYQQDRLLGFARAQTALDAQLTRHDAGYARLLDMTVYAWRNRSDSDVAVLDADLQQYLRDGQQLRVQQGKEGAGQQVIGWGTERWPPSRLRRYLALSRSLSGMSPMAFNGPDAEAGAAAYFLDARGELAIINQGLADPDRSAALAPGERESLLARLRAYANLMPSAAAGDSAGASRAQADDRRARLRFGAHPLTGRAALVTAFPAHDGQQGLGVYVAFEPADALARVLRDASDSALLVVARNGQVIIGPRGDADPALVTLLDEAGVWSPGASGIVQHQRGGRFVIASLVTGTDWALVTTYDWRDVVHDGRRVLLLTLAVWLGLMTGLAAVLVWIDRRLLAPAFVRAGRVYANERLFRSLIQMTPVGLCLVDAEHAMPVLENELARRYAGAAERAGMPLYEALAQGYASAPTGAEANLDIREFEVSHPPAPRTLARHLLVAATQVEYQQRSVLLYVLQDLTARVELQEQKDRLRDDAEAANRARSRFLAAMSHEIRTPLHGILGHLELFERSPLDAEQRTRLRRIAQSADSLLLIINDVLDLEQVESGRLDVELLEFEPSALIEAVALLYAPLAQAKGVDLDVSVDAQVAARYRGARTRIEQVLRNLVSNAIKFTASGRIEIRVVPSAQAQCLRIEVADSGMGISAGQQAYLFEPFVQADASISGRYGGSGLGLSLCRQLCQLMGGDIDVRSTLGVGSVFGFDVRVEDPAALPVPVLGPLQGQRVLLYSAVPSWRDELARRLRSWGGEPLLLDSMEQLASVNDAASLPLVVFDRNQRSVVQLPAVAVARLIRVRADGPLRAMARDGVWQVSGYSSTALLDALCPVDAVREAGHARVAQSPMATSVPIG